MSADGIKWHCNWNVQKWDEDAVEYLTRKLGRTPIGAEFAAARIQPYEASPIDGNLLVNNGLTLITGLILGLGGQVASQTATRIGIGDSSTAEATSQTALVAATNKQYVIMDSAPSRSVGAMTFISTFTSGLANYAWQEFVIDLGTPTVANSTTVGSAGILNRKVSSQGTKTAGQSWTATATITLS